MDSHSGSASSNTLSRANSRSRGISIKTVSPVYVTPNPDQDSALSSHSRASKSSQKARAATSVHSSPMLSSGSFPSSQASSASDLKTFHSRRSSTNADMPESSAKAVYNDKGMGYQDFAAAGNHDVALPPAAELSKLDINEQLRLLALKEMSVVEMRDSIANMKSKLQETESDLSKLRHLIQKSLYRELNLQHQATQPTRKKEDARNVLIAHPNENGRSPLAPSSKTNEPRYAKPTEKVLSKGAEDRSSKLWTNLSKPISFIQSLDSMLSSEFEKSLMGDLSRETSGKAAGRDALARRPSRAEQESHGPLSEKPNNTRSAEKDKVTESEVSGGEIDTEKERSTEKPMDNCSETASDQPSNPSRMVAGSKKLTEGVRRGQNLRNSRTESQNQEDKSTDDMFYAVSNSLWTFVNEVKTNVISTINENAEHYSLTPKSLHHRDTSEEFSSPLNDLGDSQDYLDDVDDSIDFSMYAPMRRHK